MSLEIPIWLQLSLKYQLTPPLTIKPLLPHNQCCSRTMQNRRNFYRILQVQPDAPTEVIRNNYRTLLQKLRLHPDLGGDQRNASLINQAWQTLRDPIRRRTYDKQLLQDYHIQILSQGHLAGDPNDRAHDLKQAPSSEANQRNFYRILNVQTDAPPAIINASYLHQIKNPHVPIELLQEAHTILSNPQKRKVYDQFFKNHTHVDALKKKKGIQGKPPVIVENVTALKPASATSPTRLSNTVYQPIITHFCNFCKTPHTTHYTKYCFELCIECGSPLFNSPEKSGQQLQRSLSRIEWNGKLKIYIDWPGNDHCGTLTNLSPGGLGFTTSHPLQPGQIIKVDGEHFKCVAKVMHCKNIVTGKSIGSCFITVLFDRQQGTFISTQA